MEITKTELGLDSAEGTINVHQGRFQVIPWQYITDTNNWALVNLDMMKKNLTMYEADEPEFARVEDFDTIIAKYRVYTNYTFTRKDWRWGIGANVS